MDPSKERDEPRPQAGDQRLDSAPTRNPWEPHCIYLYYLTNPVGHHADVFAFLFDNKSVISGASVDQLILDRVQEIRRKDYSNLILLGNFVAQVPWTRESYVALVLDDQTQELTPDAIDFEDSGHTLADKRRIQSMPAGLSGVRYESRIARRGGIPWRRHKDDLETFRLMLRFDAGSPIAGAPIVTHTDSGTNLGPPVKT